MSSPAFNEPFDTAYDEYSIRKVYLEIPDHFDVFVPDYDNQLDFNCLSVIAPNPEKGASRWTYNGRWLTIGIYRDEGRDPQLKPYVTGLSWTRSDYTLTITDPNGHNLIAGETVDIANANIATLTKKTVTSIINPTTFTVDTVLYGATSGSAASYRPSEPYNFYENNCVFRILPSFKLVPYSVILDLLQDSAPAEVAQQRQLLNITTNTITNIPKRKTKSTSYNIDKVIPVSIDKLNLERRFNQLYDENGKPLKITYLENGQATPVIRYDNKHINNPPQHQAAMLNELFYDMELRIDENDENRITSEDELRGAIVLQDDVVGEDSKLYVFDFYGFEINDVFRGPYYSNYLITRNTEIDSELDNITRDGQNGSYYYDKNLYDRFGNLVIGVQSNNALITRLNLLPLKLDRFCRPIKSPLIRNRRIQELV